MGFFKWLTGQDKEQPEPAPRPQPKPAPKPVSNPASAPKPVPVKVKRYYGVPTRVGEAPLQYRYRLQFQAEPGVDVFRDILAGEEKIVQVGYNEDDNAVLFAEGEKIFGRIRDESRMNMVRDYMKRGDPVGAVLREDAKTVDLLFFRDRRPEESWRQQNVAKLTACKSADCQEWIELLRVGDQLDLEEDYEKPGRVLVSWDNHEIGRLPDSFANLWFDRDGAALTVVESVDLDTNGKSVPSVRLYW